MWTLHYKTFGKFGHTGYAWCKDGIVKYSRTHIPMGYLEPFDWLNAELNVPLTKGNGWKKHRKSNEMSQDRLSQGFMP